MLNSGDVFAGFTIERLLGQGGMGSVYLARHPRLGKLTALKLLNRELYADREIRARFEREADLVARLDHPNIVEVYDRGTESDMLWISMQYVDGVDAAGINVATLPPERAVQVIEGVASALDYAHGMGVLHRDVKPANIILARAVAGHGERVFLTDFGIARLREDSTHLTQAGMFTATLAYASPEQMTGAPLDPTTDQYSLACALYWLLIGMGPYDSPHPAELIRGHLQLLPPPVSLRRPGLSPAMDVVLTKAMAKRPVDRFPTCVAFAKAARAALSGPPAAHPVHQQRPVYLNPPAPQPNYPGQPYQAPAYPAPPQGYPAVPPQQPAAYPAPPQPAAPQPAAPQPAEQPPAGPPQQPNPVPASNYPVPQPQSNVPPAGFQVPPQPAAQPAHAPAGAAPGYPAASGWVPPHAEQNTERVGSTPTVRPNPAAPQTPNPPAPQPQVPPAAAPLQPAASMPGSGPAPAAVADASQRPTDVVAQPVVAGQPQEDSAGQSTEVLPQPAAPGIEADSRDGTDAAPHGGASDTAGPAADRYDAASPEAAESNPSMRLGGLPGSPGLDELVAEPSTALAPPTSPPPPTAASAEHEDAARVGRANTGSDAARGYTSGDVSEAAGLAAVGQELAGAVGARDVDEPAVGSESAAAEGHSAAMTRHPESGAFVPKSGSAGGAGPAKTATDVSSDVPEQVSASASGSTAAGTAQSTGSIGQSAPSGSAEAIASSEAFEVAGTGGREAGAVVVGSPGPGDEPGYGMYGAAGTAGPAYGSQPEGFGPNPVRPGLVPRSQRAEASQVTALLVLGLAVVALVLLVVVAILVVAG